ncbi:nucleoid-associated protein [Pseudomonas sp. AA-38]|uniref:nucleoid-associated protein n=1 Tax=Pseudomonas sp. AA-38 TaxID=3028807 RepID=UPI0023F89B17|nr:nucleoid-associated protein [Pseudomonas sp. AA-38]
MEIGESVVQSVILHQIGNRLREEPLILADQCFSLTNSISNLILGGYLRGIVSSKNQYILSHESNIALNDVAHHTSAFFSKKISFVELSKNLASHLYTSTHHPNIAAGDLFVIQFENLKIDDKYSPAIGIYKSESKQQYISAHTDGGTRKLEVSSGINPELIDKGVLIIENSKTIYAIDRLSSRTKYWIDDFLKAKQLPDEKTKSAVAIGLVEKVRENIENPAARHKFCDEVAALCVDRDEILSSEIKEVSEKYVPLNIWNTELNRIIERKGLVNHEEMSIPTKNFNAKLKKALSRIDLGHDITLAIPKNLSFKSVDFTINGQTVKIDVTLETGNG